MMNEEATIKAAKIAADAAIEAARIGAEASQAQADAAHFAGWLTSGSTLLAGIIAASVAGYVAFKVGTRQMAIQERLAHIEATKVRLDLVERRAALIDAISGLSSLLMMMEYRLTHKVELPDNLSDDLNSAGEQLGKLHDRALFLFDDRADDVMKMLPDVSLRAITIAGRLRREPHKTSTLAEDPFFIRATVETYKLDKLSQAILVPLTKPDLEALTSIESEKPKKSLTERLRGFFGRP